MSLHHQQKEKKKENQKKRNIKSRKIDKRKKISVSTHIITEVTNMQLVEIKTTILQASSKYKA